MPAYISNRFATFLKFSICFLIIAFVESSCKPYTYFTSGNNLVNEECEIHLNDNTVVNGKMTVQFETNQSSKEYIDVVTNDHVRKHILTTSILYYKHDSDLYYPKIIDLQAYQIPGKDIIYTPNVSNLLFLKELTDSTAKIHLYELFQNRDKTSDGNNHYDYYISLNNESRFLAWSIRSNKLFPNFEDKISKLVADCPQLAEKIQQKESGYSVAQMSLDWKKENVVKRIVTEYNSCK